MKRPSAWTFALCLTLANCAAHAAVIIDTGVPSTSGGATLNTGQWLAEKFTVTDSYTVTAVEGYMQQHGGTAQTATVALYTSVQNPDDLPLPGVELFSSSFDVATDIADWYGASGLAWEIVPGSYFVAFEVRAGQTMDGAMLVESAPLEGFSFTIGAPPYLPTTSLGDLGIRLFADAAPAPAPEPASLALLAGGLLAVTRYRRVAARG